MYETKNGSIHSTESVVMGPHSSVYYLKASATSQAR